MARLAHQVFVISDLHLGGRKGEEGTRGFQMMTRPDRLATFIKKIGRHERSGFTKELVIAGDFVDFLAQESQQPGKWVPIIEDPQWAASQLERLAGKDSNFSVVFEELKGFLAQGHRLTIMLGNHDIELSYPEVRRTLGRVLKKEPGRDFVFIYDGEAYTLGDALIEHGNRYDLYNKVNHDKLRRVLSLQSRGQEKDRKEVFPAPAGSRLVAEVMNPIKAKYGFVDLLKPENEAVIPILLALEPDFIDKIRSVAGILAPSATHGQKEEDIPVRLSEANAQAGDSLRHFEDPLEASLAVALGAEGARNFLKEIQKAGSTKEDSGPKDGVRLTNTSALGAIKQAAQKVSGLWDIIEAGQADAREARLPVLLRALAALQTDRTFERSHEQERPYLSAAKAICARGRYRYVVFGHTHLAREIPHEHGIYLNSGTWADLMQVPGKVLSKDAGEAMAALRAFVENLARNRLDDYVKPIHTCARLNFDEQGKVLDGHVLDADEV